MNLFSLNHCQLVNQLTK